MALRELRGIRGFTVRADDIRHQGQARDHHHHRQKGIGDNGRWDLRAAGLSPSNAHRTSEGSTSDIILDFTYVDQCAG
jgi:hypothetical protein